MNNQNTFLDLFSGIGGFSLGFEAAGFETVAFCEIEDYPRELLHQWWPDKPIARDVKNLTYNEGVLYDDGQPIYQGTIRAFSGGFPCQDISKAGLQAGITGSRSGLWSECTRLIGEIRPEFAIFENVTNLLDGERGNWFKRVLFDISALGYDAEWHCLPASYLGACHRRDRVWLIAYRDQIRRQRITQEALYRFSILQGKLARSLATFRTMSAIPDTALCRANHGIPNRAHRIEALGNSICPYIAEFIANALLAGDYQKQQGQ